MVFTALRYLIWLGYLSDIIRLHLSCPTLPGGLCVMSLRNGINMELKGYLLFTSNSDVVGV